MTEGLFVPRSIPAPDVSIEELSKMSYQQVAYEVMKLFLTDFTEEELKIVSTGHTTASLILLRIAPLKFADGAYYLELFHGSANSLQGYGIIHSASIYLSHLQRKTMLKTRLSS